MKRPYIALAVLVGVAVAAPACTHGSTRAIGHARSGSMEFDLVVAGETIDSVHLVVTGPQTLTRDLDTSSSHGTVSAFLDALLPGSYHAVLSATAQSGDACSGATDFVVVAGGDGTTAVSVTCGVPSPAPDRGGQYLSSTVVNAAQCPFLVQTTVAPLHAAIGDAVQISALPSAPGGTLTWVAGAGEDGTFDSAFTEYTCASVGTKHLTVSLTEVGTTCLDTVTTEVVCLAGEAGTLLDAGAPSREAGAPDARAPDASASAPDAGPVECPLLTDVEVSPLQVGIGETIDLDVSVSIPGGTLVWTSGAGEGGTFDVAFAGYTCGSPGVKHLTVSLTKAGTTCLDTLTVHVSCVT